MRTTTRHRISKRHALVLASLALLVVAASIGLMLKPARAAGTGPTINVSGPPATVAAGATITLNFNTSAATDPYLGYQVAFTYDSSKVTLSSNGPADDSRQSLFLWGNRSCSSSWDQSAGSPMKKLMLNCAGASTTGTGQIAHAVFTAIGTGIAVFHMQSLGSPDNGGAAWGTYTYDANGPQDNTLTCSAGHCGPLAWLPSSQTWDVVVDIAPPDVTLTKSASAPNPANGAAENFTLQASNTSSTTTATGVVISDTIPSIFTVTGTSDPTNCSIAAQTVTCTYASIAAGASQSPVVQTTTGTWPANQLQDTGQSAQNCATVTLHEADSNTANNTSCVTVGNGNPPDVWLSGFVRNTFGNRTAIERGDPFWYNITVQNQQPYLSATNVQLTASIPNGVALPLATMPGNCTLNANIRTVNCTIGTLGPRASTMLTLWMAVDNYQSPLPASVNPCFTATLDQSDPNLSNNSKCDADGNPLLTIAADSDGDGYSDAEETAMAKNPNAYCAIMRADVNYDGSVNISDIAVAGTFNGKAVPPAPGRDDQNADGVINTTDLNLMSAVYTHSVSECP